MGRRKACNDQARRWQYLGTLRPDKQLMTEQFQLRILGGRAIRRNGSDAANAAREKREKQASADGIALARSCSRPHVGSAELVPGRFATSLGRQQWL